MSKRKHTYERAKRKRRALRARTAEAREIIAAEAAPEPAPVAKTPRRAKVAAE